MFAFFLRKHHIVLRKGQIFHILSQMVINWLMLKWLCLKKWFHGIHRPIIHYYAVCWNEEKMLPFMFDYYERFVDSFIIYDNYSNDRSEEIISSHNNASVLKFKTDGFDDTIHAQIKNNCWKHSRGKADFVIVCDLDEFLFHPELEKALSESKKNHVSLPSTDGYNMYSKSFPSQGESIVNQLRRGVMDDAYSKPILFDPHRIVEINYQPGAHSALPVGSVFKGNITYKVLHFKNLGLEYVLDRYHLLAQRLSKQNIEKKMGVHYLYPDEKVIADFNVGMSKSVDVI